MNQHVLIFDIYSSIKGLSREIKDNLHTDYTEEFTIDELCYWWVVINLESMYCLSLHEKCTFPGSLQLRYFLESLSDQRNAQLYRDVPIPPVECHDTIIDISGYSIFITL